ncbi:hypothetical protein D3C76_282270 [compost metagenome]
MKARLSYKITSNMSVVIKELEPIEVNSVPGVIAYLDDIDECDSLVFLRVNEEITIHCFLDSSSFGVNDLTVYCLEETRTIFIGGKKKSFSINMNTNQISNEFEHCLFWDFNKLSNGLIFETGELDCLLRESNGTIISHAPVDPPYEIFYEEDGIRFSSIVYGTTYLKYPEEY